MAQHIAVPSVKPILYGSVAALLFYTVNFNDTGLTSGVKKCTIQASATNPVLLEFSAEVTAVFDGTTPLLTVGSVPTYQNFLGAADITEGTLGFYPASNAKKSYRLTANTDIYIKFNVGTLQVETATGVGTVTVAGNAAITVTGAGITGSPVVYAVPVTVGAPTVWAPQVAAYLALQPAIASLYMVTSSGATIIFTRIVSAANDATLNIAIATGTATGITAAPTSADTTAGVLGTPATTGQAIVYINVTPMFPLTNKLA